MVSSKIEFEAIGTKQPKLFRFLKCEFWRTFASMTLIVAILYNRVIFKDAMNLLAFIIFSALIYIVFCYLSFLDISGKEVVNKIVIDKALAIITVSRNNSSNKELTFKAEDVYQVRSSPKYLKFYLKDGTFFYWVKDNSSTFMIEEGLNFLRLPFKIETTTK